MAPKCFKNILTRKKVHPVSSSGSINANKEREITETEIYNADFETAVAATKLGKFNIILFLLAIPAGWTSVFETTTMSYVFPAAHCDLNLSLDDKGSLNAITFLGMVTSGFAWGYLCDTLGRKKLMVAGYLLDALFVILSSLSQNYTLLIIFKFFGGFIINGPFAALAAYLSEFHSAKYRSRVQLGRGMIVSCGTMVLPLLAWAILPQKININLKNHIVLHSWNIYLLVCAVPSLISGISFIFMPESPKFLMTVGRNHEALAVFQQVFSTNTGKSKEEFPIKSLQDETALENIIDNKHGGHITANRSKRQALKEGFQQIKPLCFPPHLKYIILVCAIQSLFMLTTNTLRLWLPQIFQSISDYQYYNNGTTASLCTMLEILNPTKNTTETCYVNFSPSVYLNTMIIAMVSMLGYVVAGTLINRLGRKILLVILLIMGGSFALSLYFAQNTATVLALSALFLSFGGICGNILLTVVIDLFPTSLRTITISLVMMLGRSASMGGNLLFPILLKLGCAPPFISIGSIFLGCSFLAIFLPNTDLKALK